jgi:hypothetical protein
MKFPIDRIPSCPSLKFRDLGQIMAVGQNRLKIVNLEFFTIIMKFLKDRVLSCLILEKWDFGRIREQATGAGDHGLYAHINSFAKTFQMSSHLFNLNHRNLSYAC